MKLREKEELWLIASIGEAKEIMNIQGFPPLLTE